MKKLLLILYIALLSCNPFSNELEGKYTNGYITIEFIKDNVVVSMMDMELAYSEYKVDGDYIYIQTATESVRCKIVDDNTIIYAGMIALSKK